MRDDNIIKITDAAAAQIREAVKMHTMASPSLRIAVMIKGDGSFHYALGFDEQNHQDDLKLQANTINVVVNSAMISLLRNMTLDYVELEKGQYSFIFMNPNDPSYKPPSEA